MLMGTVSFVFIKPDPVSGSWMEEITASIILLLISTGALSGGVRLSVSIGTFGFSVK